MNGSEPNPILSHKNAVQLYANPNPNQTPNDDEPMRLV